jgi:hypothetical protein
VDKCINCQFYDRKREKPAESRALQWGQCRRTAPMLNPTTAKSYMIEGVWPTVRDDDWCGEWKLNARRTDARVAESLTTATHAVAVSAVLPRLSPINAAPAATVPGAGHPGGQVAMAAARVGAD